MWAGQTFGSTFDSDGRLTGTLSIQTVPCNASQICRVRVPAPAAALIFLYKSSMVTVDNSPTRTFATTQLTKTHNTATVDPSVLATSNGQSGMTRKLGSTSAGSESSASSLRTLNLSGTMIMLFAVFFGRVLAGFEY